MTTDIVPVDNMAALDTLDAQAREVAITSMLDQARTWLAHAVESTAPAQDIAHFKAFMRLVWRSEGACGMSTYGDLRVGDRVTFRNGYGLEVTAIRPGASPATVRVTARALDARGEVRFTDERLHRRATKVDGAVTVADIGDVR